MAEYISIRHAADMLDVSTSYIRQLRSAGTLTAGGGSDVGAQTVLASDVGRMTAVMRRKAVQGMDLAAYARSLREQLHPSEARQTAVMRGGSFLETGLAALSPSALRRANLIFGRSAVHLAAKRAAPCGWCWAHMAASVYRGSQPDPTDTPEWRALFGGQPCPADRKRWADAVTAAAPKPARLHPADPGTPRTRVPVRARSGQRRACR